ncbi:hypothetical protein AB0A74_37190 [Saccharothrix sp. NPDC042600]|uniref:hypothetical protein n=1 Tax=Saccharothrix TaxID=2071 RepID=UPI0034025594|nr:hypothetical protein GCM10017745_13570 [Saccharothrix mutabilis subsp. capreolus]
MSADFFETGDWLDGYEPGAGGLGAAFGSTPDAAVEPAYPARFGWTPPLVPLPRRAPDELF